MSSAGRGSSFTLMRWGEGGVSPHVPMSPPCPPLSPMSPMSPHAPQVPTQRQCISFGATQEVAVGQLQPAMAAIYDYYEPGGCSPWMGVVSGVGVVCLWVGPVSGRGLVGWSLRRPAWWGGGV